VEDVRESLRDPKLAITVSDSYEDILDVTCDACTFFENDKQRIGKIANRSWTTVNV